MFVTGKPIVFDDGAGDTVEVWMQKLSDPEVEEAAVQAGAKRAVRQRVADDETSNTYLSCYAEVRNFGDRKVLIDAIVRDDIVEYRGQTEAELMSLPEWGGEDDNILSLLEAWEGNENTEGLKHAYARGIDAVGYTDAAVVKDTLTRFDAEVDRIVDGEIQRVHRDFEGHSDEQIFAEATKVILERQAMTAFLTEFNLIQVYFATRDAKKHRERYFEDIDEVRYLPDVMRTRLIEEYSKLEVDATEGKDSPATPDSSESSGLAATEATDSSSGPADATG